MTRPRTLAAAVAAAALASLQSCACDDVPADAVTSCDTEVRPGGVATDILFVVDDSDSMRSEQVNLRQNLLSFIERLSTSPFRNDFRIGVTTTSVESFTGTTAFPRTAGTPYAGFAEPVPYPAGALVAIDPAARTTPAAEGRILYDLDTDLFIGTRVLEAASPTLVADFEANVLVGVVGSSREQPFRAARAALTPPLLDGPNAGFLRPGARLVVVFLSDEDDCSGPVNASIATSDDCQNRRDLLDPVADFATFVQGEIGGEQRSALVAVIAGVTPGTRTPATCSAPCPEGTTCSARAPAVRLVELLDALPAERSSLDSICSEFAPALEGIADRLVPQSVPLEDAPADWRMLAVSVVRGDGSSLVCPVALAGTPEAATAGAVFVPPQAGAPASITFQPPCELRSRDRVDLRIVCAG